MKERVKKVIVGISFMVLLTVGVFTSASAKFWGWETSVTTDWADGQCAYRETCRVHYTFWIPSREKCNTVLIACLYD